MNLNNLSFFLEGVRDIIDGFDEEAEKASFVMHVDGVEDDLGQCADLSQLASGILDDMNAINDAFNQAPYAADADNIAFDLNNIPDNTAVAMCGGEFHQILNDDNFTSNIHIDIDGIAAIAHFSHEFALLYQQYQGNESIDEVERCN